MIDYYCGDNMKRIINRKIDKSLKRIDKEKEKIKDEKRKIKLEKQQRFYNTKFGKFLKDFFDISDNEQNVSGAIKRRMCYNFMNVLFGIVLCLVVLFVLSGGKNYLKLNYELSEFIDVYDTISSEYYGKIDKEKLLDAAINSMMNSVGDDYTTYSNSSDAEIFFEDLEGSYEGIGCMVSMDSEDNIRIVEIFEDTPASKAGLKEGDIILSVDGVDYSDKTSDDMANYIKEEAEKEIELVIKRDGEKLNISMFREKVEVSNVTGEVIERDDKKIGYIKIGLFTAIANIQFEKQLKKLEKQDIEGLIIDVRNNSGGYLNVVTDISSLFLEKGKVIYQLETDDKKESVKDKTKEKRTYPIAVVVNVGSASASEILAASIKESYGGYVVGVNTYGKGTVQKTKKLKDGSMIKYTIQNWLTPNGNYIDQKGISPTDIVEFKESGFRGDSQLDYSINLVKNAIK